MVPLVLEVLDGQDSVGRRELHMAVIFEEVPKCQHFFTVVVSEPG